MQMELCVGLFSQRGKKGVETERGTLLSAMNYRHPSHTGGRQVGELVIMATVLIVRILTRKVF